MKDNPGLPVTFIARHERKFGNVRRSHIPLTVVIFMVAATRLVLFHPVWHTT